MMVLAVLAVLENTLPLFCWSYKIQDKEAAVTVLTVLAVMAVVAVSVVTATPLKLSPPFPSSWACAQMSRHEICPFLCMCLQYPWPLSRIQRHPGPKPGNGPTRGPPGLQSKKKLFRLLVDSSESNYQVGWRRTDNGPKSDNRKNWPKKWKWPSARNGETMAQKWREQIENYPFSPYFFRAVFGPFFSTFSGRGPFPFSGQFFPTFGFRPAFRSTPHQATWLATSASNKSLFFGVGRLFSLLIFWGLTPCPKNHLRLFLRIDLEG